ncbi:MAG: calcium/sodium antiporter [Clostridia bacterium]|nr:calcium/sodium antiporter [Clostridia bacterium]
MALSLFSLMEVPGNAWACAILLVVGIILVVKGGDWFVDAASWIAEVSGIPTFIIGATIVSVATTLPEVLVSSISAAEHSAGMAIGNAVGSVNCNIALIMAMSLLFMPGVLKRRDYVAKICMLLGVISVLWGLSATGGVLEWWEGLIVIMFFFAFMVENLLSAKRHAKLLSAEAIEEDLPGVKVFTAEEFEFEIQKDFNSKSMITIKRTGMQFEKSTLVKNIVLFIVGAAAIVLGAQLMCDNGAELASLLGVSDALIGVTILAVGTSLPELVTAITAIAKKKSDLSVGNVIGANIIDISLILPLCTFITAGKYGENLPVSSQSLVLDFPFCLAVAGLALLPALIFGKFKRWQGGLLLAGYVAYITLLVLNTLGTIHIF